MLWTDRKNLVTVNDLRAIDSQIIEVADGNQMDLESKIFQGCREAGDMLIGKSTAFGGGYMRGAGSPSSGLSYNHIAAVMNVGGSSPVTRFKFSINQVVVSGLMPDYPSHLSQWIMSHCLHAIYRDAFNRTIKDAYKEKMELYAAERRSSLNGILGHVGVPIVLVPFASPGAEIVPGSGRWGAANVSMATGTSTYVGDLLVAVTWTKATGANNYVSPLLKNNAESGPSNPVQITTESGKVVTISIASLNPPTGVQNPATWAYGVYAAMDATHWNIYIGKSVPDVPRALLYLQNPAPIPISTTDYALTGDPVFAGYEADQGQVPDAFITMMNMLNRA